MSGEYVPTTKEVRAEWSFLYENQASDPEREAQFDRWLTAHNTRIASEAAEKALRDATAEIERLRRWKAEALPVIAGLQELGQALGLRLGQSITGAEAAQKARELAGQVERVRAVCADPQFEYRRIGDFDTYDAWHEGASDALGYVEQALNAAALGLPEGGAE